MLDAADDIAADDAYLVVRADTLSATAGGSAWIELLGASDIAELDIANAVGLAGTGTLTYGRIRSRTSTLDLDGFSAVLGDGRLRTDGGTASLLDSAGTLTVSSDSIDRAAGFAGTTRIETASNAMLAASGRLAVDRLVTGASAELTGTDLVLAVGGIGTDLTAVGTTSTTLGTVTSGGAQTYGDGDGGTGTVDWTTLTAGGNVTVDVGGDVDGTTLTGDGDFGVEGEAIGFGRHRRRPELSRCQPDLRPHRRRHLERCGLGRGRDRPGVEHRCRGQRHHRRYRGSDEARTGERSCSTRTRSRWTPSRRRPQSRPRRRPRRSWARSPAAARRRTPMAPTMRAASTGPRSMPAATSWSTSAATLPAPI